MALSDMKVYQDEIQGTTIELVGQKMDAFNASSGNALQLSAAGFMGDFSKESFFNTLSGAQRRVDRNAAIASQSSTALTAAEMVGVKVAGGFGPILFEPSQLTYLQEQPASAIRAISEAFSDALLQDQLNTALACAVAAVENVAALTNDYSATGAIDPKVINQADGKFSDMSGLIRTRFMRGSTYHNLVDWNIDNGDKLFTSQGIEVVDYKGKIVVVTDAPALYEAGTPNKDKVLNVVAGGIIVDNTSDVISNMDTTNGKTRIETTWQSDYTFGVKLKGYSWDTANGGASPTDAELATGSNWDINVSDNKHTLGTIAVGDADA